MVKGKFAKPSKSIKNIINMTVVNLRIRLDETLGRISNNKKLNRGFEDYSTNTDSNLWTGIKIHGLEFKMCGRLLEI